MTAKKPQLGDLVDVPEDGQVTRPDGTVDTVTGGSYVLDAPGTYDVAGTTVEV